MMNRMQCASNILKPHAHTASTPMTKMRMTHRHGSFFSCLLHVLWNQPSNRKSLTLLRHQPSPFAGFLLIAEISGMPCSTKCTLRALEIRAAGTRDAVAGLSLPCCNLAIAHLCTLSVTSTSTGCSSIAANV